MRSLRSGSAVSIEITSDPRHLCLVRTMVRSFAQLGGFAGRQLDRIALAVDEACANVIRHAHGGRCDGDMTVTCAIEEIAILARETAPLPPESAAPLPPESAVSLAPESAVSLAPESAVSRGREEAPAGRCLVVRVQDHGTPPPGGLLAVPECPDLLVPGGLGLRLMHDIMDAVTFRCGAAGNELELVVACPVEAPPAG